MIEVKHLTKRYGDHTAVNDLSITIPTGQIYGFLGPNGAGKTTTMNIMTGCLAASEGQVLIDGHDIYQDAARAKRRIGYLPEQPPLYPDMTPGEYLRFVGQAKGLKGAELKDQLDIVMDKTHITNMKDRLIKNLSKGYRQRVGIAQAILGSPDVIILDEPMVGLDPAQIIEIRELIRDLGQQHTVILSSHILSEISMVCDHIMIISKGNLVASGTPEELSQQLSGASSLRLSVKSSVEQAKAILEHLLGVERLVITRPGEAGYDSAALAGSDEPTSPETGIDQETEPRQKVEPVEEARPEPALADSGPDPGAVLEPLCTVVLTPEKGLDIREDVFFAFCDARVPILGMSQARTSLEDVFLEVTADQPEPAQDQSETYLYGNTYVAEGAMPEESAWTQEMLQPLEPIQMPEAAEEGEDADAGNL